MSKRKRFSLSTCAAAVLILLLLLFFCRKGYEWYMLDQQIQEVRETRQELLQEKQDLEERKEELNDPAVIERKARDDLGMVRPGEVPYVR